ncbi:hypothetical protein CHS0354_013896 [Potamilus streckersoni]|uniref:Cilia- and flagella-associated protein 126 n=1 Tax=Potamilus streckersoni TaxID=2493646 RepID=A0AAE0RWK9_9BIVA|nr:hypothetical protein CHS0354_013896 [Potamilus streckersoni]
MSLHFSANQYDSAFKPKLLQNWEVPSQYRERPRAFQGFTQIVANDKGHLLPGVKRSRVSPWGTFIGTWDMPRIIPGNKLTNSMARAEGAIYRLERVKSEGDIILSGALKRCKVPSPLPVKLDKTADKAVEAKDLPLSPTKVPSDNRSGARNPEPQTAPEFIRSPVPPSRQSLKPPSPKIDWPRPMSQEHRAKSASPKLMTSPVLPPIPASHRQEAGSFKPQAGSPEPELQNIGKAKTPINWPSPKDGEAGVAASPNHELLVQKS